MPVVVLSHGFWVRRFAADPAVIGRELKTDPGPREIIGAMPRGFEFPSADTDVIIPIHLVPGVAGAPTAGR